MKLVRYGPAGRREARSDRRRRRRFATYPAYVDDIAGAALSDAALAKLATLDPAELPVVEGEPRLGPCVGGVGKFICIGLNYSDHAAETGATVPPEPDHLHEGDQRDRGPNDDVRLPRGSTRPTGRSSSASSSARDAKYVERGRRAGSRRRLLRRQRRLRARVSSSSAADLGQGQGLRHVRPDRALAGHKRRGAGPAGARHVARGQRPVAARTASTATMVYGVPSSSAISAAS